MKRKFVFLTFLFFSFSMLFAVPDYGPQKKMHKNFHGKRMLNEENGLNLLFVSTSQFSDSYNFELIFSEPVDPESVNEECFYLNGNKINIEKIRFSKNYRTIDFFINQDASINISDNSELLIKNIKSISEKNIEPVLIKDFKFGQEYRLLKGMVK